MRWIALLLLVAAAAPAAAQDMPNLSLTPGESIVIHFDDGGRIGPPERGTANWTPIDVAAARQLAGATPPDAPVNYTVPVEAPDSVRPEIIPGDLVQIRMFSIAGRHSMLVIENGQRRALIYRARITSNGRSAPTDVCVVPPGQRSFEHWPYLIERLELSDFRFIPWAPGREPTCE
jgi:hypothetical protein